MSEYYCKNCGKEVWPNGIHKDTGKLVCSNIPPRSRWYKVVLFLQWLAEPLLKNLR